MRPLCGSRLFLRCLRCGANLQSTSRSLTVSVRASVIHADSQGNHSVNQGSPPDNRPRQTLLSRYAEKFHKPGDLSAYTAVWVGYFSYLLHRLVIASDSGDANNEKFIAVEVLGPGWVNVHVASSILVLVAPTQ